MRRPDSTGAAPTDTEYAFDRNALLLRACACVLRLMRVWRLITDIRYLYTMQLTAWTDAFGFEPRVSAGNMSMKTFSKKRKSITDEEIEHLQNEIIFLINESYSRLKECNIIRYGKQRKKQECPIRKLSVYDSVLWNQRSKSLNPTRI